jgi:glucoamylase
LKQGSSFFTINSQHRALVQGSILAKELDLECGPCGQAPEVLCFLSSNFWNATGGYLTADINVSNVNRSGINTDQILGSVHAFDIEAPCDAKSKSCCMPMIFTAYPFAQISSLATAIPWPRSR